MGGWSFGEAAVPMPAWQDPGGLADVSCLSGVHGPDKCRGRARGSAVSSVAQPGRLWGTPLPGSAGHAGAAARRPWVPSDWPPSKICSGQRYGVVWRSLTAPRSCRQQSIPPGARAHPWLCQRRSRFSPGRWGRVDLAGEAAPSLDFCSFSCCFLPSRPHASFISSIEIGPWRETHRRCEALAGGERMWPGRASPRGGGQLQAAVLAGSHADAPLRDLPAPHLAGGETEARPCQVGMGMRGAAAGLGARRLAWPPAVPGGEP